MSTFSGEGHCDPYDEYDDYYDDYDEYDDYYDDYDLPDFSDYECPAGDDCVTPGSIRKDVADYQNDRIVQRVEQLRAKVAWARQVFDTHDGFKTQSTTEALRQREDDLKNQFYNIDTTGGCYNYYDNTARPRKPRRKKDGSDDGNGGNGPPCENLPPSITLFSIVKNEDNELVMRGRINHEPSLCGYPAFDYTQLNTLFESQDMRLTSPPTIMEVGKGLFQLTAQDYVFTDAYYEKLEEAIAEFNFSEITRSRVPTRLSTDPAFKVASVPAGALTSNREFYSQKMEQEYKKILHAARNRKPVKSWTVVQEQMMYENLAYLFQILEIVQDDIRQNGTSTQMTKAEMKFYSEDLAQLAKELLSLPPLEDEVFQTQIAIVAAAPLLVIGAAALTTAVVLSAYADTLGRRNEPSFLEAITSKQTEVLRSINIIFNVINAGSSAFDVYKGQLELGKALGNGGRKIGDAAHHIIQKGKQYAGELADGIELARQCFGGGGIENKASGAWLDPKLHGRVHTGLSRANLVTLFAALKKSPDPCSAFRSAMEEIKQCLTAFAKQWDVAIYQIAQEVLDISGPVSTRQIYQLRRGKTTNALKFNQKLDAKINSGQLDVPDYIKKDLGKGNIQGKLCGK